MELKLQAKPQNKGKQVYEVTLDYLDELKNQTFVKETKELLYQRYKFGISKYGQPLMSEDGREEVQDCVEELADAIQYLSKAKYNKRDLTIIKELNNVLTRLLNNAQ